MAQNNYDTSQHLLPSAEYNDQAPMPQQFVPLPETPYSDNVDSEVLLQLKILVNLQQQALRRKPIGAETIYNGVLQLLAFCLAVAFGVFTIISWQVAREANGFATTANGLASTANTLARDAALQGDRADGVAEQANCMAAGALVLSLLDFCDSQASNQAMPFARGCQSLDKYADVARAGSSPRIGRQLAGVDSLHERQTDKVPWFDNMVSSTWQQITACYDRPQDSSSTASPPTSSSLASTTSSATSTNGPGSTDGAVSSGSPNGGAIAAIVVCSLLGVGVVIGLICLRYKVYKEQLVRAERVLAEKGLVKI